jgi:hypothetical protein
MKHLLSALWHRLFICPRKGHWWIGILDDYGKHTNRYYCPFCMSHRKVKARKMKQTTVEAIK